ncbi:MAG: Trk system potassium transporter TrkA [Lachnospiraceae bacterium]|nr:Trk system potassium transporter TrkA [Lachnospiraceae bacterium]MCI9149779.1 Trk system potassium transporter TrkA [Lachnospiraceae bacterium]
MKILIAGCGKLGKALTRQLSPANYDITLIDTRSWVLEDSAIRYDTMAIEGNCASMNVLIQAGVMDADLLIAATGADELNLLCCMTAHGLNKKIHTIARVRNPEYTEQIYKMRETFGLSLIVNPEKQAAIEIVHLLKYPGFLKRDTFAKGRVEIVELRIDASSKLCNVSLSDMDRIVNCRVLICAVLRDGTVVAPDGNFTLRDGDRIFVTAPLKNLTLMLKNLGIITHKAKRVVICGGGRVSFYLAQQLTKSGVAVQLIEQDEQVCTRLASLLPDTCIVQGDASNQYLLESEGLADSDALLTMTGLDELNVVISLYGKSCGVPQIITKVARMDNTSLLDSLPLGSIICPKELCCNTIVRYVRAIRNQTGAALAVHTIADGQAEAMEFRVDSKTLHCNEKLKTISLKPHILVVCISHGSQTEIPNGDSVFRNGDTVVIVSTGKDVIYQLNDIFRD